MSTVIQSSIPKKAKAKSKSGAERETVHKETLVEKPKTKKTKVSKVTEIPADSLPPLEEVVVSFTEPEVVEVPETETALSSDEPKASRNKRKQVHANAKSDVDGALDALAKYIEEAKEKKDGDTLSFLKSQQKVLKKINSDLKKIAPKVKKVRNGALDENAPKQPSGFSKPVRISQQIADFANWDVEEPKSRTDVTRILCSYIKENNLQDADDRRIIIPDAPLRELLQYDESNGSLTFANMQKYLKGHYSSLSIPVTVESE